MPPAMTIAQWALSIKFFPWIKPLVMPLNTRGTGAAQKNLRKVFTKAHWKRDFTRHYDFSYGAPD